MKKILIADDQPHILILMQQTLEPLEDNYDVVLLTAKDGMQAFDLIQKEKPDLVFLDIMMPYMSGLEVCQKVKQSLEIKDTYIILLTARGQEFDRQNGINVGADLYITKPFRPKAILAKAQELLGLIEYN